MISDGDAFDDRKKSQEAKYKMDEERRFKLRARRNKLLGLWAASQMGLGESASEEFAKEAVMIGFETPDDGQFIARLSERAPDIEGSRMAEEMARAAIEADRQLAGEFPDALDTDHQQVGDGPHARKN